MARESKTVTIEEPMEESLPALETVLPDQTVKEIVPSPPKEVEEVAEEKEDEEEQEEKRKVRRRKKKHGSEDAEDNSNGHRVVICDDQVDIRFSQSVLRASEVLSAPQIDKVKTSGYCDFLIVSELGCGIQRGCMSLGRLYQGKYVPPERTDGLLPESKRLLEEQEAENKEEEENNEVKVEVEAATADIDLD